MAHAAGVLTRLLPLLRRRLVWVYLLSLEVLAREEFGVAAEEYVRAAPRHVRGNRDRALASGLRDDLGLALVVLGVEDVVVVGDAPVALDQDVAALVAVAYAGFGETARDEFGGLDRDRADQDGLPLLVQ